MKIKIIIIFNFVFLLGCEPSFKCEFHPQEFELIKTFSLSKGGLKIEPFDFEKEIEKFGLSNGYCIANGSMDQPNLDRYLLNIRIIKNDISFYISGTDGYDFWFQQRGVADNSDETIEEFCALITPFVSNVKVSFSDKEKLCF